MLRIIASILFSVTIVSACSNEHGEKPIDVEDISVFDHGVIAKVTTEFQDEGCEALLELEEMELGTLLLPMNLEEKYKVHGLKLLITYNNSRIMQSECQKGRPIMIEKIKLIE